MDRNEQARQRYALAMIRQDSLEKTTRHLAELVNQHTLLLMAISKHIGKTPGELVAELTPEDFVNPADNPLIENEEPAIESKIELTDEQQSH